MAANTASSLSGAFLPLRCFIHCGATKACSTVCVQAIRFLHYCIDVRHNRDKAVHNLLLSLLTDTDGAHPGQEKKPRSLLPHPNTVFLPHSHIPFP